MTPKEVNSLAGQVQAACIIMSDVKAQLYSMWIHAETREALDKAKDSCMELRDLLRRIAYEQEDK